MDADEVYPPLPTPMAASMPTQMAIPMLDHVDAYTNATQMPATEQLGGPRGEDGQGPGAYTNANTYANNEAAWWTQGGGASANANTDANNGEDGQPGHTNANTDANNGEDGQPDAHTNANMNANNGEDGES